MPMGQPALKTEEIALFREWIRAGAQNEPGETASPSHTAVYTQPPVITALRFSPDGKSIAVSGNSKILIHKADGSGILARLQGKAERILSMEDCGCTRFT